MAFCIRCGVPFTHKQDETGRVIPFQHMYCGVCKEVVAERRKVNLGGAAKYVFTEQTEEGEE